MGGRGASGGGRYLKDGTYLPYGSEYKCVYQLGNIKFIRYKLDDTAKTPMETMTPGRIYVTVNRMGELKAITQYDKQNKRYKQIDLGGVAHTVDGLPTLPHTHFGYFHDEHGTKRLSTRDAKLVDKVRRIWLNRHSK